MYIYIYKLESERALRARLILSRPCLNGMVPGLQHGRTQLNIANRSGTKDHGATAEPPD